MAEKVNDILWINAQEYNKKLATALKKIPEFKKPGWVEYVKSAASKKRPIEDEEFWYKRAASILRQIYKKGVVGVNRLRTKYGSRKNRGMKPERFRKAGGKIIRIILQQADEAGFTEKVKGKKSGRKLTDKGKKFLEEVR